MGVSTESYNIPQTHLTLDQQPPTHCALSRSNAFT